MSDAEAMDLIMSKAENDCKLGRWVWSKVMNGQIDYVPTEDSCMWNKYAKNLDANVRGLWSAPKWVWRYMLVMVSDQDNRDRILVQAGNMMPVFAIEDKGLTRYSSHQVRSEEVKRGFRKAFFKPKMSAGGDSHLRRTKENGLN